MGYKPGNDLGSASCTTGTKILDCADEGSVDTGRSKTCKEFVDACGPPISHDR